MATKEEIENVFTYHAPTPEQVITYERIREGFKTVAFLMNELLPESPIRTRVFNQLVETNMLANQAIALGGRSLR